MNKVIIPLVLVLTITIGLSSQEAYAVPSCLAVDAGLLANEVYIGDNAGVLWKLDTSDASSCSLGTMTGTGPAGAAIQCFDVALDPVSGDLFCITPADLWKIDQDDGPGGPADANFVGALVIQGGGGAVVSTANGMDSNAAGTFYIVDNAGRFFTLDITTGISTQKSAGLGASSAGDLAWDKDTGKMWWTADGCIPDCPGQDGLWEIDLVGYTATFKHVLDEAVGACQGGGCVDDGFDFAFAMDFLPNSGNLCIATAGGELFMFDPVAGTQVGMTKVAVPAILANGGTANNAVAGGIVVSAQNSLILGAIFPNSIWMN